MNFSEWLSFYENATEAAPKVLWITGMGSTGEGPKWLAAQGYDVEHIGTTTNRYAAYLGRFKRYPVLGNMIGGMANRFGQSHLTANMQKHDKEKVGFFQPDVIVGSSQGGAIAMQVAHKYPQAKFVLIAPAWRIFGADPSHLPSDTIIIQGKKDIQVPAIDSKMLSDRYGFRVVYTNDGHKIPKEVIKNYVDSQLKQIYQGVA